LELGVVIVRLEVFLAIELFSEAHDLFLELDELFLHFVVLVKQFVVALLQLHFLVLKLALEHLVIDFLFHHSVDLFFQLLDLLHVHVYRVAASDVADVISVVRVELDLVVGVFLVLVASRVVDGVS
jgi:hypothetical protein